MPSRPKSSRVLARGRLGRGLRKQEIERRLEAMMATLQLKDAELSVLFASDVQMRELNRLYRKKDRTTDVLAFPMTEGPSASGNRRSALLGDLVVSVAVARKQAKAAKHPLLDEVTLLLAHGLLHLVGWDHETVAKDKAMRAETERLCAACEPAPRVQQRHSRSRKPS